MDENGGKAFSISTKSENTNTKLTAHFSTPTHHNPTSVCLKTIKKFPAPFDYATVSSITGVTTWSIDCEY